MSDSLRGSSSHLSNRALAALQVLAEAAIGTIASAAFWWLGEGDAPW